MKSLWVLAAFIPFLNGLGFAYIGAKEFNSNWIKEGLIYELPWFLMFLFINFDGLATFFTALGFLFELISIVRTFIVYFKHKDVLIADDQKSQVQMNKILSSYWVIFEGLFFEFLWVLYMFLINPFFSEDISYFFISIAMIGFVLSIVRTFMVYFEEERMGRENYDSLKNILDNSLSENDSKPVEGINDISDNSYIIPQFRPYNTEINDLKNTFDQKEENINNLITKRFDNGELSYDRFMDVIKNCHKLFYHQSDSALSIINLAPEYSIRLDETVKGKIYILKSIIEEMNHLIEELIIHDGDDESDEELKELFSNMDNLINSVKDYK